MWYLYLIGILCEIFFYLIVILCTILISHCDSLSDIYISLWLLVRYFISLWFFIRYLYLSVTLCEILIPPLGEIFISSYRDSSWDIYISSGFLIYIYISPGFFVRCLLFISHQDSSWDMSTVLAVTSIDFVSYLKARERLDKLHAQPFVSGSSPEPRLLQYIAIHICNCTQIQP